MKLVHVVLNVLCIGGNDRTVVMVDCVREFVALVRNAGVENKFHAVFQKPGHMSVGKLGRIALGLTWNGLDSKLINLSGGGRGKHYLVFQFCKEGIPERIILKHIQYTRDTYLASHRLLRGKWLVGEQTLVLIFIKVRDMILVLLFADTALAAVSAYKLAAACEFVDGKTAVVGTSVAVGHGGGVFQLIDLVNGKHGGLAAFCVITLLGNQGSAESTHDSSNIRADGLAACNTLKASKNTVVIEGTALYNNVFAKLLGIGNLDNLVKSILDNRVGKSGRDICDRSAFLLGLFYLGVHKYGTSGTKVNRMLCKKSGFGEILHGVVQGFGKGFNKGTAARGTCLVQLYAVNGLVADLDALHILSADIYDTVNLRIKESSCIVMGNGLNLALIQQQGSLHQCFAVACGTGKCNVCIFRKQAVNLLNRTDSCFQRASVVVAVEGIKQGSVLAYKSSLGGGGTCVNTQIAVAVVLGKVALLYLVSTLTLVEGLVILLCGKKRLHTFYLEVHLNGILQAVLHIGKGNGHLIFSVHGRTHGCEKVGILRCDGVFVIQLQGTDKSCLQLIQEVKRTAKECNMSADGFTAGKTGDGLVHHCLENGSGKVFLGSTVIDQGLDICLGKYAAAGCDWVKCLVILRVFVQSGGVCLKQGCHLVDEGTGTACADSVHTLFNIAAFEVDDLGILAAKLDGYVSLGCNLLKGSGDCDNLLDKRNPKVIGKGKSAGTCDHRMEGKLSKLLVCFLKKICESLLDVGKMTLVVCEKQGVIFVKYCDFDSGGTNVNS